MEIIPEGWEVKRLVECCSKITDGTHDTPKPVDQGIPFLTAIHVKDGFIDFNNCYYLPQSVHEVIDKRCNPEKNDVLMVNIGAGVATTALINVEYEFSLKNVALLKTNKNNLIGSYLNYCLSLNKFRITNQLLSGGAQPFLSLQQIGEISIPLPATIEEQKAIAQSLSDVDALITECDRAITKKRNIKQGTMQQLLTGKKRLPGFSGDWEVKNFGEMGECIIGLTYKPENVKESGLLVLRSSNIGDNQLKFDDNVFVDIEVPEKLITKEGDILICVRNGSRQLIGKNALIDKDSEGFTFGAFMSVYRTKFYQYIFHAFQSSDIKRQIHENIGATINQITNNNLSSFQILLPSLDEQKAIAQVLSDMDTEIAALEQKRDKYKAIKQGMMQELLTGKTRLVDSDRI
jgi:type I restriction enzyme S subunit